MKRVAVYVRVSTSEQHTEGQEQELRSWLDRNAINTDAVEWFIDHGESGNALHRPELNRLREGITKGTIRTVVVYKLDRLSRKIDEGLSLVGEWAERGVRVVSTTQQVDVSGTMGKMLAALLFGFAQIETEYRMERQRAGIEANRNIPGKYRGRKPGTFKAKPDRARQLRDKGLQVDEIATALGCSARTVLRYLAAA